MAKKPVDKDAVRKIWLAGIGAYGRAYTEAKGAVDSFTGKSSEVFDELVKKGEILESVGKFKANELVGKGKAAVEDITPDFEIDDRIAKMRARLSGAMEKSEDRLAARVDRLEAKLDAILEKLDIGEAAPAQTKTSVKKPTVKTSKAKATKTASKKKMTTQRTAKSTSTAKQTSAKKKPVKKSSAKTKAPKKTTAKKPPSKKS